MHMILIPLRWKIQSLLIKSSLALAVINCTTSGRLILSITFVILQDMKKILTIVAVNLLVLLVTLALLEGLTRLIFPATSLSPIFNDSDLRTRGRSFIEAHPSRGFALKPNFTNPLYHINSQGFRGEEFPANFVQQYYKVLALGESTTFGWQVNNTATYPAQLNKIATAQHTKIAHKTPYFINAGIPSYTSSQTLAYLEEILSTGSVQPDMILLNIMWNDIWYSSIKNWHADILIYQKPPALLTWLTEHSRLVHLVTMGFSNTEKLLDIENSPALQQYAHNLQAMLNLSQKYHVPLMFVEPPMDADHMAEHGLNEFQIRYSKTFFIEQARKYRHAMHTVAENAHIPVLNHALSLDNLHQKALFIDLLHPTVEGNAIMATNIYTQFLKHIPR